MILIRGYHWSQFEPGAVCEQDRICLTACHVDTLTRSLQITVQYITVFSPDSVVSGTGVSISHSGKQM